MTRPNELRTYQTQKLSQWYHDPLSCLQTTIATVLEARGAEPLHVLGLQFGFTYVPGHVTHEEFYYPETSESGLLSDLAPFHDVCSWWWKPSGDDLIGQLYHALVEDGILVAAVDNFHLPYRPAFHDVHAAHLIVIDGLDEGRRTLSVSDAQPPAWRGHIELQPFLKAWGSSNPSDDQDAFFSDSEIDYRCLRVEINDPFEPLEPAMMRAAIEANLRGLTEGSTAQVFSGLAGVTAYLSELVDKAALGKSEPLEDLYAFAWPMHAQGFMHGELLRWAGLEWSDPGLAQLGRAAHANASAWTNLRILGAHVREDPATQIPQLQRRTVLLRHAYEDMARLYDDWLTVGGRAL